MMKNLTLLQVYFFHIILNNSFSVINYFEFKNCICLLLLFDENFIWFKFRCTDTQFPYKLYEPMLTVIYYWHRTI